MKISNSAVNRVGDIIRSDVSGAEYNEAILVLDEWRKEHGALMDTYYDKCVELNKKLKFKNVIIAQRLKRLPTIVDKLNRFKDMELSRMQDIAGVRIVAENMVQLRKIEQQIEEWQDLYKIDDYIKSPKASGYRCKHFIFRKDGMFVEIQLRTQIQHLWATAVETMDIFRGTSMKTNKDETYWHDFFCQASSVFARIEGENVTDVYEKASLFELCEALERTVIDNNIFGYISSVALTSLAISDEQKIKGAYYIVMNLNFDTRICNIFRFKELEYAAAVQKYQDLEGSLVKNGSVVLVSVNDLKKIKDAYPNYFMDLSKFIKVIKFTLEKYRKRR